MNEENKEGQQEGGQESKQEEIKEPVAPAAEPIAEPSKEELPTAKFPRPDVNFGPDDPNSPLWDGERGVWLDRKTGKDLRNQDPGVPNSDYIGKHDVNSVDDEGDKQAMRRS